MSAFGAGFYTTAGALATVPFGSLTLPLVAIAGTGAVAGSWMGRHLRYWTASRAGTIQTGAGAGIVPVTV